MKRRKRSKTFDYLQMVVCLVVVAFTVLLFVDSVRYAFGFAVVFGLAAIMCFGNGLRILCYEPKRQGKSIQCILLFAGAVALTVMTVASIIVLL